MVDVEYIGPADPWPEGVPDRLTLACQDCGDMSGFDYHVTEEFWRRWVPGPERLGVICLPCLDWRCGGEGLVGALESVTWTGPGYSVVLHPSRRIDYAERFRARRLTNERTLAYDGV